MSRTPIMLRTAVCVLFALLAVNCSRREAEKSGTTSAKPLTPAEDYKATMDAYSKAKDPDTRTRLWLQFLERNPNNDYTLGTIRYVVTKHYLEEKKDSDGAVKFALEHMSKITNPKLKRRADTELLQLYGKVGKSADLRQLALRMDGRGLDLPEHLAVAEAAVKAKDWELASEHCQKLLKRSTPDSARSEPAFENSTPGQISKTLGRYRGQALMILGEAALESGHTKPALMHFTEAGKLASYDFAGLPSWPLEDLHLHWARALLKGGNAQAAIKKILVDATIQERAEAVAILQEACKAAGIKEDIHSYMARVKGTVAKKMPSFTVYSYDNKSVPFDELKGTVTLVAFWFPT